MAIVNRTATSAEVASGLTVTGNLAGIGAQAGDYVLAHFAMSCTPAQFTGPGGSWVQLLAPRNIATGETLAVYGMFDPASGPVGTSAAAASRQTCLMQAWGGVDTTTPVDVAALVTAGTAQTLALTGITTLTDGARLVSGVGGDFSTSGVWTKPAEMTLDATHTATGGRGAGLAEESRATQGATGTRTWTSTATAGLVEVGYLLALRPATTTDAGSTVYGWDAVIGG